MDISTNLALILSGAISGFVVGLTGVGGGALMTPILLLFFGFTPTTAIGTDLWFAAITKIFAGKVHQHKGLIDWLIVKRLWFGSLPMTMITIILMKSGWLQFETNTLKSIIAITIAVTSIGIIFQENFKAVGKYFRLREENYFKRMQHPLTIMFGAILGVLVTLTSIGAGAIGVVFLTYLYPLRLTPARLIATDITHAIPLAIVAGVGHLIIGNVNYSLLGWLLIGSIPLVLAGAKLSAHLPNAVLRASLSIVLITVSIKLIHSNG